MKKTNLLFAMGIAMLLASCGGTGSTTSTNNASSTSSGASIQPHSLTSQESSHSSKEDTSYSSVKESSATPSSLTVSSVDEALNNAKQEAIAQLEDTLEESTIENKAQLQGVLNSFISAINEAKTVEEVQRIFETSLETLQEQIAAIQQYENMIKLQKEKMDAFKASIDLTKYDAEGQKQINSIFDETETLIKDSTDEADMDRIINEAKEKIALILDKVHSFYQKMQFIATSDFPDCGKDFSLDGDKIINNNIESWTEFQMGSQNNNSHTAADFYITMNYKHPTWSTVTVKFRKWDNSSTYKMIYNGESIKFDRSKWDDQLGQPKIDTITTLDHGIVAGEKTHIQILSSEWKKEVFINGECVFTYDEGDLTVGYFGIETWQAAYTLEDFSYQEYVDKSSFLADYESIFQL